MSLVKFVKTAAGGSFGPYEIGDIADLSSQTITDLGDAVVVAPAGAVATEPSGTA